MRTLLIALLVAAPAHANHLLATFDRTIVVQDTDESGTEGPTALVISTDLYESAFGIRQERVGDTQIFPHEATPSSDATTFLGYVNDALHGNGWIGYEIWTWYLRGDTFGSFHAPLAPSENITSIEFVLNSYAKSPTPDYSTYPEEPADWTDEQIDSQYPKYTLDFTIRFWGDGAHVPEPSSLTLAVAILCLPAVRRRR